MRIINETSYRTDQLRALIVRVAQDELSAHQKKILRVKVVYARAGQRKLGHAFYGTVYSQVLSMTLYLDRDCAHEHLRKLALIIAHEMAHCRGMRHREMRGNRYHWVDGWAERYAYAQSFPLEQQVKPSVMKPGDAEKHAHALTMMQQWTSRAKKASTLLKKWARKARYYERKMAAKKGEAL